MSAKLRLHLKEVAQRCEVEEELIIHFVSSSWIQPAEKETDYFDEEDLARIILILDLKNNFGVNDEAVPLILHLIDQLNLMHRELKKFRNE